MSPATASTSPIRSVRPTPSLTAGSDTTAACASRTYALTRNAHATHKRKTTQELYRDVCRLANAMKAQGVKKDDVVMIYMPMVRRQRKHH